MRLFDRGRRRHDDFSYGYPHYGTPGYSSGGWPPDGRRPLWHLLVAGLVGWLVACIMLFLLLRWPWTGRVLRPLFIGPGTNTPIPTAMPSLSPTSTALPSSTPSPTPTPSPSPTTPQAEILYAVDQTTAHTFSEDDPESKAADLLTGLGVPPNEQQIGIGTGGLPPAATLPLLAEINDLAGAVYDPPTGRLLLLGTHNPDLPEIDPADLLVALRAVYSGQDDIGVSIDPINPNDFGGPMQVHYSGNTGSTHFGLVMYEADRYLKALSMGQDNITGKPIASTVPGYRSELDWMLEFRNEIRDQQWHRMWYLVQNNELEIRTSTDGHAMMFDEVPLVIEARFVVFDQQGQKHDIPGSDPAIDAFVGHFNTHFAEFAAEKPEVGQLYQLAKLLSIARWLRDNNLPVDLGWLSSYPVDNVETPTATPGQIVSKTKIEQQGNLITTHVVTLYGGVDFQFTNKPIIPPPGDPVHLLEEISGRVPLDQMHSAASVTIGDKEYQVAPLFVRQTEISGNLRLVQKVLSVPTGGRLALDLTFYYDSFNTEPSPLGPGWGIEPRRLYLPPQRIIYLIDGQQVELYDTVTVVDPTTGKRRRYRITKTVINGRVIYVLEEGEGPAELYYDYLEANYSLRDGEVQYFFADDGLLQTQVIGNESVNISRDTSGNPTALEHSDGMSIRLSYGQGRLTEIVGSDGTQVRLAYDDSSLAEISRTEGTTRISYAQGYPSQIRDGPGLVLTYFDDMGRIIRRQSGELSRTFNYVANGSSIEFIDGIPGRLLTIERNRRGQITRVIVTEEVHTADVQTARAAVDRTTLEQDSVLQLLLENPRLDLSWFAGGRFRQVIIEPVGKRTLRVEGESLIVDGRLRLDRLREGWETGLVRLEQLRTQGYDHLTLDPESGVVAGLEQETGEAKAFVPGKDGTYAEHSFPLLQIQPEDLPRLVTDLGGQSRGLWVAGLFQTVEGGWALLTPAGELRPVLSGAEAMLQELYEASRSRDKRDRAQQIAQQLGNAMRRDIVATLKTERRIATATKAEELIFEAYPLARQLFAGGLPSGVIEQIDFQRGQEVVHLPPIETSFGWLLPGAGSLFLDIPSSLGYLISYHFGINNVRLIAPHSTPLRAQAYLDQEQPIKGDNIAVVFTPHSQSNPTEAEEQRLAFEPIRQRLESLGVRVIDIGENPKGHEKMLAELASEDLVVFEVLHSGPDGRMYIYGDGTLHPRDFQVARGVKHFMTCCSVQNGVTAAAVRAGADSATGAVEPITLEEVNALLERLATYLEQHPKGVLPSVMEHDLRIQTLIEEGGPGRGPGLLPTSRDPDADIPVCG